MTQTIQLPGMTMRRSSSFTRWTSAAQPLRGSRFDTTSGRRTASGVPISSFLSATPREFVAGNTQPCGE